jgi:gliding motility-associated-like protein
LCENTSAPPSAVIINTLPSATLTVGGSGTICSGTGRNITVDMSETGVNYQLRNSAGNINVGSPAAGTGSTINLPTGSLTSATSFNILATNAVSGCSVQLTQTAAISVDPVSAGGSLSGGSSSITYGNSTGTMTLSGHIGSIIKWQKQVDAGVWQDIINTSAAYIENPSSAGTWQYRVNVKSGVCPDTYSSGSSTIVSPKPLPITANNQTKTYGTAFTFTGTEFTAPGLINGDNVASVTLTSAGSPSGASVTGSPYPITPSSATGTGLNNYSINYTEGLFTVNKAPLTITADNKTKEYLAPMPSLTYTISGFVNGENQSALDVLPLISTTADQNSLAGSYPITVSGGNDNCYSYTYVAGVLTITKIPQVITFTRVPENLLALDTFRLAATSSSGLAVQFESLDPDIATVLGNVLTGKTKGSARIRAFNDGDQNFQASEALAAVEIKSTHRDIMNLFTPNGDGLNDYWELPEMQTWGKCDVKVYNRWGKLVFADPEYNNLWNGASGGNPLPEGPYYFVIKTENSGTMKGTVNIVR